MKLYAPYNIDCHYSLNHRQIAQSCGPIELTEDEYIEFTKLEIKYMEWQDKIEKLISEQSKNEK